MNTTSKIYVILLILIMAWLGYKISQNSAKNEDKPVNNTEAVGDSNKQNNTETQQYKSHSESHKKTVGVYEHFKIYLNKGEIEIEIWDTIAHKKINKIDVDGQYDNLLVADFLPLPEAELILSYVNGGSGGSFQTYEIYASAFDSNQIVSVFKITGWLEEYDYPELNKDSSQISVFGRTFVWNGEKFVERVHYKKIDEIAGKIELYADLVADTAKVVFPDGQEIAFSVPGDAKFHLLPVGEQIFLIMFNNDLSGLINIANKFRMTVFQISDESLQEVFSSTVAYNVEDFTDGYQSYFSQKDGKTYLFLASTSKLDSVFSPVAVPPDKEAPENHVFTYVLDGKSFVLQENIHWYNENGPGFVYGLRPDSVKVYDNPSGRNVIYRFPPCDKVFLEDLSPEPGPEILLFSYETGYKWGFDYNFEIYNLTTGTKLISHESEVSSFILFTPQSPADMSEWFLLYPSGWEPFALIHDTSHTENYSKVRFQSKQTD